MVTAKLSVRSSITTAKSLREIRIFFDRSYLFTRVNIARFTIPVASSCVIFARNGSAMEEETLVDRIS